MFSKDLAKQGNIIAGERDASTAKCVSEARVFELSRKHRCVPDASFASQYSHTGSNVKKQCFLVWPCLITSGAGDDSRAHHHVSYISYI